MSNASIFTVTNTNTGDEEHKVRRDMNRKRQEKYKLYHDEMYKSIYWQKNPHNAYKSFNEQINVLKQDFNND